MSRSRQFHKSRDGKAIPTEEEYRLLGDSVKNDPEAVSIQKPVRRHSDMLKAFGGPKPRNTLSRPTFAARSAEDRKKAPNVRGRNQYELSVEVHKGGNVESVANTDERNESLPTPPSAKRRKLDPQASPASSDQTDPLDRFPPHAVNFHTTKNASQTHSRTPSESAHSQMSGLQMKRSGSFEYYKVEDRMNSNPKSKKQRCHDNRNYPADHKLLPSSPSKRSSVSYPIDIPGDEPQTTATNTLDEAPRPAYRGTARQPSNTVNGIESNISKSFKERAGPTQSPYFDKHRLPTIRANGNVKDTKSTQTFDREYSSGLAHKFVAVDGTRRGSDFNASSDADEIQSLPTTVGHNADPDAVFSVEEVRPNSASKESSSILKPSTSADDPSTLAPSIIKPSFASSDAKRTSDRPPRPAHQNQEAKPPWSIPLTAISFPGNLFKDDDLGLVYDQKLNEYFIQLRGLTIQSTYSSLRIRPQKLFKVSREKLGNRLRLESSRNGTEDNILDLEFACERDVTNLLRRLEGYLPFKANNKSSEHMQKAFEKRQSELRNLHGGTKDYQPEIIEIVDSTPRNGSNKNMPTQDSSRPRQKSSLVGQLVLNATRDIKTAASQLEQSMPAMPNGLPQESCIEGLLAKLKPSHNEHLNLRRSTRNSAVHDDESLLSTLDAIPQNEKYSVKHGLGDPWKKPLTYPKVGKKRTTVEWSDLERLDEGEFLNDNLISFYLRYLEQRLEEERPELAKRVYFFNTFFFATLTNAHKGRKRLNYEGVQKWTRSVDLFTYDYIIVPINEQAHWYLAIICNLAALDRDLAMHEDEAISPVEDGGTIPKRGSSPTEERASSSTNPPKCNQSISLTKEPNERATRDSFSQLSLDNDGGQELAGDEIGFPGPQKISSTAKNNEDKEMLDSQIQDTMPGFFVSEDAVDHPAHIKEQGEEVEDPVEDQGKSPKATGRSRKSKRKSLPAPITKVDPRKPAIITFDSLGLPRSQTIKFLKDYLREEAKAKRNMEFEESLIRGINAKRIPQQDNYSDCGVFLLGYVDTFLSLETDPRDFIAKTIQQTHDVKDWSKLVPGSIRASIRNQVQDLHEIQTIERREESAKKSRKTAESNHSNLESSPLLLPDHVKVIRNESNEDKITYEALAITSKTPESSRLEKLQTIDETSKSGRHLGNGDFIERDDMLGELPRNSERGIESSAENQILYNSDDAERDIDGGKTPTIPGDNPSIIMIDSQSQRGDSAPRGTTSLSFSSGKQSYPESTSSKVVNPAPLSIEKGKSPELADEIPDSQNSATSPKVREIPEDTHLKPASSPEGLNIISDSNQTLPETQGESNDRSKRRKIGREERVDIPKPPEKQEMIFTLEEPIEPREQHKDSSKRRKRTAREVSRKFEEPLIHVIDD